MSVTETLIPATPRWPGVTYLFGIRTTVPGRFRVLDGHEYGGSLPNLLIANWEGDLKSFTFATRDERFISFKTLDDSVSAVSDRPNSIIDPHRILDTEWKEGIALYYDYLAAYESETVIAGSHQYHVVLDERDSKGKLLERRLIFSGATLSAARYMLRMDSLWLTFLWHYYNGRDIYAEYASTKYRTVTEQPGTEGEAQFTVLTEYPHSRGRRRPYMREFHWHVSRLLPLVPAGSAQSISEDSGPVDERWVHRPGDPKLLREHATGLFGSYPLYEGDDEPEFRDER